MKRSIVAAAPVAPKALMTKVRAVEAAGFIVDFEDEDATRWTVALVPRLLKQHGLNTLVSELKQWALRNRKPVAIVLEMRFGTRYPDEPPFIRVVRA
eukprot:1687050-Prymnesium_polylepis.2